MTAPTPQPERHVAKSAEQQMRSWVIGLEVRDRLQQDRAVSQLPREIHPCVVISREAGAGGSEVARQVGQKLGWQVLDKELLNYMADHYKLPKDMLEFVDETTSNWLHEVFGKWLDRHLVSQSEYVRHLGRMVLMAARHASSVFVGRGVQLLLPREKRLSVRTVAPLSQRVARVMQQRQLDHDEAKKYITDVDEGRSDFVQRYFHHDVRDPYLYDLIINTESIEPEAAAELIVSQCRRRFPG